MVLEFAADFEAGAGEVVLAHELPVHRIDPHDPGVGDRDLIAEADRVLVVLRRPVGIVVAAQRLHRRDLDHDPVIVVQVEEILDPQGPAVGIRRRVVQLQKSGQPVGLEVQARVKQHRAALLSHRLRPVHPEEQVEIRHQLRRPRRDQRILQQQQIAVRRLVKRPVRVLAKVPDPPHAVRQPTPIAARIRHPNVVVVEVVLKILTVQVGIAQLEIPFQGIYERRDRIDVHVVVVQLAVLPQRRQRVHLVERHKRRDFHVRDVQRRAVDRRYRRRRAGHDVRKPDPILQKQRHQSRRDRNVQGVVFIRDTLRYRSQVALEKQRAQVPVQLVLEPFILVVTANFPARKLAPSVQGLEKRVYPLRRGNSQVKLQVRLPGELRQLVTPVVVERKHAPEVPVEIQMRRQRVLLTQQIRIIGILSRRIYRAPDLEYRPRLIKCPLAAVYLNLRLDVVRLLLVRRVRSKYRRIMLDPLHFRRHLRMKILTPINRLDHHPRGGKHDRCCSQTDVSPQ